MKNPKKSKGKKRMVPLWLVVAADILLVGLILVSFACFHHVLPAWLSRYEMEQIPPTAAPVTQATESAPPVTEPVPETEPSTEPATEPDNRTEWQRKFADKFSDDVVLTDTEYRSPQVSVTLQTISVGEGNQKITYHVADVYIASIDNFITRTAHGQMRYFDTQDVLEMDAEAGGILSVSGDFLTYQKEGFLMRNGEVYVATNNLDSICVLYADGVLETYEAKTYRIDEILARNPVQVWSFGPPLLDENGKALKRFNVSTAVSYPNPRSAIGYYEPGHYCFVLVDGRQNGYSKGMEIPELARVFEALGCKAAYNLDGGGSAVMVFNHEKYSSQSNGDRALGDILVIRDDWCADVTDEETGT